MLTDIQIKKTKYQGKSIKLFDGEGLYLLISKKSKRWYFRYTFEKQRKDRPLGKYPIIDLLSARKIAIDAQIALSKGQDPFSTNSVSATFSEAFEALFAIDEKRYSQSTMQNRRNRYEKYIKEVIGDLPLLGITPQHVLNIVLPLHDAGKETTAKRLRIIVGQVYRDGAHRYGLTFDPSQASQGLKKRVRVKHHQHIEDKRILGRLLADLETGNRRCSLAVRFSMTLLPYLFVRPAELRFAKRTDFNLDDGTWRITDGKMQRTFIVPLATQIVEKLEWYFSKLSPNQEYLFSSYGKSGVISDNTFNKYLRGLGYGSDIIVAHGFRGTASTILNEMGYKQRWIDKQLDHKEENEVREAYDHAKYLKHRRQMMQDYADYLDQLKSKYAEDTLKQ